MFSSDAEQTEKDAELAIALAAKISKQKGKRKKKGKKNKEGKKTKKSKEKEKKGNKGKKSRKKKITKPKKRGRSNRGNVLLQNRLSRNTFINLINLLLSGHWK